MKKLLSVILIVAMALSMNVFAADAQYEVTADPVNIEIDGIVGSDEWGEPTFSTTPAGALALQPTGWDYWSFTFPGPTDQSVEFYITNDTDYVYVAGKMVNANKDLSCPSTDVLWQYPHMVVTFGSYEPGIVCPKIEYQGEPYELYTCYYIGMVAGKPFTACTSQGILTTELSEGDYNMSYDDATKSYHYEMRIPLDVTTLDIWNNDTICLGLDFTDAPEGGQPGNRYLISQAGEKGMGWFGPNNFYFQNSNPLIIKLKDVEDVMSMRGEIFIPEKIVKKTEIEPLDVDYYKNYKFMPVTAACAAVAAIFAVVATVVTVIKKKK